MGSKPRGRLLALKCSHCGGDFSRYASSVRHPEPTCSLSCARAKTPNKPQNRGILECEICTASFVVIASRLAGKKKARFCSDACKNIGLRGEGSPAWKGGDKRSWTMRMFGRRIVKERGACELCGSKEKLHAHHIKPRKDFPELEMVETNILVVCPPCHAIQHPELAAFLEASPA